MSDTAAGAWDTGTDPANPRPNVWPECSTPNCGTAYVYRRGLSLSKGWIWYWSRDCKHKSDPVLMTEDGPYNPEGDDR